MNPLGPDKMQAGWIDTPEGQLFTCYHPPQGKVPRPCAVLMCDPFGSDRMNLHLSYRAIALRLAEAGFAVLRVDYPGTCDSSGYPRKPSPRTEQGALASIFNSLHIAADVLRAQSGAAEICAFGATLGGTFATVLAAERTDITGLLLWGALPTGKGWLREMTAFRAMTKANPEGKKPTDWQEGDQEALGFLLTASFIRELTALDVTKLSGSFAVSKAGIFRRNADYPIEPFAGMLARAGAEVYVQPSARADIAALLDERAYPPAELVDEMVAFCERSFPPMLRRASRPTPTAGLRSETVLVSKRGVPVRERVLHFGTNHRLFGILSEPVNGQATHGVIMVNGGPNHRVGINRNYTDWARTCAELGMRALRIDLRGIGDSPPPDGEPHCKLYRPSAQDDVREAIDAMQKLGVRAPYLLGLCAGGYHSLHVALSDARVSGLVMLSPLRMQRVTIDGQPAAAAAQQGDGSFGSLAYYRRMLTRGETWKRVLKGDVNVRGITRSLATRVGARVRARIARATGGEAEPANWLCGAMLQLVGRGSHVLMVLDAHDPISEGYHEELDADRERIEADGRFTEEMLSGADHIFTPLWSQQHIGQLIEQTFQRWMAATPTRPSFAPKRPSFAPKPPS